MSKLNINFNDYKSSGVYFLEIDNSIIDSVVATSGRLAVGFSKKGPFNTPVYIDNTADLVEVYGDIDTKLERKGVFFNRNAQTLINNSPCYFLNLMPFSKNDSGKWEEYDKVGYAAISSSPLDENETGTVGYPELYDKSRFWKVSTDYLDNTCIIKTEDDGTRHNLINIANVGSKDVTFIIRKAENIKGFNKTVSEWYKSDDNIPYSWMNPSDYISDYFIEVIAIEGKWNDPKLALDTFWGNYFELDDTGAAFKLNGIFDELFAKGKSLLKRDKLSKFLKLDAVNVLGDYTGTIIPDFIDGTGALQSIEPIVNQYTSKTGVVLSIDVTALEDSENNKHIDFIGHTAVDGVKCNMMSYDFTYGKDSSLILPFGNDASVIDIQDNKIIFKAGFDDKDTSTGASLHPNAVQIFDKLCVGAMVSRGNPETVSVTGELPTLVRVTKKQIYPDNQVDKAVFTTTDIVDGSGDSLRIVPSITDSYKTLTPIVLQGLDMDAKVKALFGTTMWKDSLGYSYYGDDAAIAQIYAVLEDKGIKRSLLNDDIINFRYVIDTMARGLGAECGSKKYLARLANNKQHCTAIINAPSMTEFGTTSLACYYDEDDVYKTLDTKYIPEGGNDNLVKTEEFSLPSEENGSKNCGVFAPYLKYRTNGRTVLVPPAADVANAYMKKYDGADPYITVANRNGVLSNGQIQGIEYQFDRYDQDYLEPFGINPILYRNGEVLIYGDRTAYQDVLSDYNYLHVREILNTIEIECKAVLEGYVFRYNNAATRSEIVNRIDPILKGMKDAGALYQYELQMDENNNTNEVINRSFAIIDIGVWITKNMEKVIARITVNKLEE